MKAFGWTDHRTSVALLRRLVARGFRHQFHYSYSLGLNDRVVWVHLTSATHGYVASRLNVGPILRFSGYVEMEEAVIYESLRNNIEET